MAGRIADDFIETLRSRTDIVEVISGYMSLTQKGSRYWGLCPFHGEKTPSFSVDRQRQLYYCFGCHKGGNVFRFVMEQERVEFVEAVKILAERAGMPVPETPVAQRMDAALRQKAIEASTCAARFFRDTLLSPEGQRARDYLAGRDISQSAIRRFGIGYAPEGWDKLTHHLKENGYTDEQMLAAGLVVKKDSKCFDMFRGRVIFPIFNPRGQVIAFGGRILTDAQPKYLNSSDTAIFNKRRNLYGLHLLRGAHNVKTLYLVEGYVDVVSLVSHGIMGAVATLGTAITSEQAMLMKRYCQDVVICYDGDEAGQKATVRALQIFDAAGVTVHVCVIPGGQDPDDYVRRAGAQAFLDLPRRSATQYLLEREKRNFDLSQSEGRTQYAMAACRILRAIKDPVVLEGYVKELGVATGFTRDVLLAQIGRDEKIFPQENINLSPGDHNMHKKTALPDYVKAQRTLLNIMASGQSVPQGAIRLEDFTDETCRAIAKPLLARAGEKNAASMVLDELESEELRNEAALIFSEQQDIPPQQLAGTIAQCVAKLQIHTLESQMADLAAKIQTMPPGEQAQAVVTMQEQMKRLNELKQKQSQRQIIQ